MFLNGGRCLLSPAVNNPIANNPPFLVKADHGLALAALGRRCTDIGGELLGCADEFGFNIHRYHVIFTFVTPRRIVTRRPVPSKNSSVTVVFAHD